MKTAIHRLQYAWCMRCACPVTYNHARIVLEHVLAWGYGGVRRFVSTFRTALTVINTLAVVLLGCVP